MYKVIDNRTGDVVGTYKSRTRAYNMADRKDSEYGAVRYSVKFVG